MATHTSYPLTDGTTLTVIAKGEHSRMHPPYFVVQHRDATGAYIGDVYATSSLRDAERWAALRSEPQR